MAPHFTELGRDLDELNEEFLELVAGGSEAGLPASVDLRLQSLDRLAARRLAAVPFALFGFGFEDEDAWTGLLSPGVRDREHEYTSGEARRAQFTLLALAVLRSGLRSAPHSIASWIGLPRDIRWRLAAMQMRDLAPVAMLAASRLRGRLAQREGLWHRFIDAAESRDERQLAVLAALGKQWTIRRALGLVAPRVPVRGFRR